ncbi:hypothetical protein AYI70_g11481, partial [Smittium culicis]
MKLVN